jgi:hypothetical protein
MNKYRPYADMGTSCATRKIREKKIIWPDFEKNILVGKYRIAPIRRSDVAEAATLWRAGYPELYGSSAQYAWVLYPDEYETRVAFKEAWTEDSWKKPHCMTVVRETKTDRIISLSLLTKDDRALHVEYSLGCVHPDYRGEGEGLMVIAFEHLKAIEEETDTEYMTAFCETWHSITQYLCFKQWGWKIAGIFPGQVTRWCGENREYRGCIVHFYKFLGDSEKYVTKPEEWKMLPEVAKIWRVLEEVNKEADGAKMKEYFEGHSL